MIWFASNKILGRGTHWYNIKSHIYNTVWLLFVKMISHKSLEHLQSGLWWTDELAGSVRFARSLWSCLSAYWHEFRGQMNWSMSFGMAIINLVAFRSEMLIVSLVDSFLGHLPLMPVMMMPCEMLSSNPCCISHSVAYILAGIWCLAIRQPIFYIRSPTSCRSIGVWCLAIGQPMITSWSPSWVSFNRVEIDAMPCHPLGSKEFIVWSVLPSKRKAEIASWAICVILKKCNSSDEQ